MVSPIRLGPTHIQHLEDSLPPHFNEQTKALALAGGVLKAYLGVEWAETHVLPTRGKKGFLSVDESNPVKKEISFIKLIDLAETLYNLQWIGGFDECISRMRKGDVEGSLAELDFARMLFVNKVPFRFVIPIGVKKLDYDFDIICKNEIEACADSKCKIDTTEFSENGIRNVLQKARKQLPNERPGIIFVKVPERWLNEDEFQRLSIPCANRFLGGVRRIVSIKFYTTRVTFKNNVMRVDYAFKEISNPNTDFGNDVDWSIFRTPELAAGSHELPEHFERIILGRFRIRPPND
jgi:hypothetical protein